MRGTHAPIYIAGTSAKLRLDPQRRERALNFFVGVINRSSGKLAVVQSERPLRKGR
jgi:hypothetical protein